MTDLIANIRELGMTIRHLSDEIDHQQTTPIRIAYSSVISACEHGVQVVAACNPSE